MQKGFTLLEILVALSIFTIVAFILTRTLHTVLMAQSSTERNAEQLTRMQISLLLFSRELEQAMDRPVITTDNSFIGTKTMVTFIHAGFANPSGQMRGNTLQRTRYRIDRGTFIRDTWDALNGIPAIPPHSRPLLTHVKQLSFRYLDKKGEFHFSWPSDAEKLPRAVEISITFFQGGSLQQLILLPQEEMLHVL